MENPSERSRISPTRIDKRFANPEDMTPEDVFNLMPYEIVDLFLSRKGNLKFKKANRFRNNLGDLMDIKGVAPMDLLKISADCIKKNGSIDERMFFDLLEEIKLPQNE